MSLIKISRTLVIEILIVNNFLTKGVQTKNLLIKAFNLICVGVLMELIPFFLIIFPN